ncbi:uncharacterized protein LOC104303633 isoform X3 [Dryobates pubescens]|uniref:uncharacterized protein LOC104303633 isoform X3 n=1 Tax=Dryobates pubescens TaxID=118200 RepID=UPI0023B93A9C|nr:uncharacterized protein LOC104303633 isoform X3 [Dryobates pubescens]
MEAAGPQATALPAGEPQAGAEEIDMSLDDIIKRHRNEQPDASTAGDGQRQAVKSRNSAYGYGRPRFRAWTQRSPQGPKGFRRGFGQQQFSGRQFRNAVPRPRRKAAAAFSGVSPLNRQDRNNDAFAKSSSGGQPEGRRRPPPGPKRFGAAAASTQASGRRGPGFQQKRMQQRFNKANFQRGQMDANGQAKPVRLRRWKVKPSPAAVLTVSVANPQAGQSGTPGYQRPFLRSQRPPPRLAKPQPKGVLLRFNFRAMANQVEDCQWARRHLAACSSPATKLLTPRSGFGGCQLGLCSVTQREGPATALAGLLTQLKAPEKTVQQLQTQPSFPPSVGPSWPAPVLAQSWEMLLVSAPGQGNCFTVSAPHLPETHSRLCSLFALVTFLVPAKCGPRALGAGQRSSSTIFGDGVCYLDSLVVLGALCRNATCLLLARAKDAQCLGAGCRWEVCQPAELLASVC